MYTSKKSKRKINNIRYLLLILTLLSFNYSKLIAQNIITLSQAIHLALQNRNNLKAGKYNELIGKLQTESLYRKYWPKVDAQYSYINNPILQTSIIPIGIFNPAFPPDATKNINFGTKWNQTAGLNLTQPILDLSVDKQISESKLNERITKESQLQNEYDIAYQVTQTYIDISIQKSKIESAIADTQRTWINYSLQKNRFDEQRLLKLDLNRSIVNHNNSVLLYRNAITELIEDKVYFLFLIGDHNITQPDFDIDHTSFIIREPEESKDSVFIERIPEINLLNLQSQFKKMQIQTEKAKYIPTIELKGFLGANHFSNTFQPIAPNTWFGYSYVGLNVKYPLLFGENKRKILAQLNLQSEQILIEKEEKIAQLHRDALTALLQIKNIDSEIKTQKENIELTIETLNILKERFLEGQESASTINTEEKNLQQLIAEHSVSQKKYWRIYLDYLKATGRLETLWKIKSS